MDHSRSEDITTLTRIARNFTNTKIVKNEIRTINFLIFSLYFSFIRIIVTKTSMK